MLPWYFEKRKLALTYTKLKLNKKVKKNGSDWMNFSRLSLKKIIHHLLGNYYINSNNSMALWTKWTITYPSWCIPGMLLSLMIYIQVSPWKIMFVYQSMYVKFPSLFWSQESISKNVHITHFLIGSVNKNLSHKEILGQVWTSV